MAVSTFDRKPVDKSSMITTSCPSDTNLAAKFEPINPAPPVTATLVMAKSLTESSLALPLAFLFGESSSFGGRFRINYRLRLTKGKAVAHK